MSGETFSVSNDLPLKTLVAKIGVVRPMHDFGWIRRSLHGGQQSVEQTEWPVIRGFQQLVCTSVKRYNNCMKERESLVSSFK